MDQSPYNPLNPKRGQPLKYASTEEKKASRIAQQRNQRQFARAAQRAQQFDHYYFTVASLPTDINEPPPTYFPPEELSLSTEVELLLPHLSSDLGPWKLSTLAAPPIDDELPQESTFEVNNRPATDTPLEGARDNINQDSAILELLKVPFNWPTHLWIQLATKQIPLQLTRQLLSITLPAFLLISSNNTMAAAANAMSSGSAYMKHSIQTIQARGSTSTGFRQMGNIRTFLARRPWLDVRTTLELEPERRKICSILF